MSDDLIDHMKGWAFMAAALLIGNGIYWDLTTSRPDLYQATMPLSGLVWIYAIYVDVSVIIGGGFLLHAYVTKEGNG